MNNAPVRITSAFVAAVVLAVAVFAAFYILGAIAAVVVCAALGLGLIALVAVASRKLSNHRHHRDLGEPMPPAHAPTREPQV